MARFSILLRRIPRALGAGSFIGAYRVFLSPLLHQSLVWPGGCRFHPTCSAYGQDAIRQYGLMAGLMFIFRRLGHCHPWTAGGFDPLPPKKSGR